MSDTSAPAPRVTLLSELVSDLVADTEAARLARESGLPRGPVTRLRELDEALGGYLAPGVHILQAAPGAGKTAFALQSASSCFFPALYVTAEMPMLELFRRLIARETGTYLGKLKTGELGAQEAGRLAVRTVENLPHFAIMDGTRGYASPASIRDVAESLRERAGARHVLVVIDSIQIWARSARSVGGELVAASDYDLINAGLSAAARLGADLACPILAISHRNRAGQKDGGMHAGKGSGDLEYMAETVIDLSPDKDTRPDVNGETGITLAIHKNRHGLAGVTFALRFCGRLQEFRGNG
jgi:replicative DNA helicase